MKKFLVYEKEIAEGCDYMIGCGSMVHWVESDTIEEVIEKTIWPDGHEELSTLEGEQARSHIMIVEEQYVHVIDVKSMSKEIAADRKKEKEKKKAKEEHDKDMSEIKRLSEKYNIKLGESNLVQQNVKD